MQPLTTVNRRKRRSAEFLAAAWMRLQPLVPCLGARWSLSIAAELPNARGPVSSPCTLAALEVLQLVSDSCTTPAPPLLASVKKHPCMSIHMYLCMSGKST